MRLTAFWSPRLNKKQVLNNLQADFNILLVDWRGGSSDINYMQCASNIRVVGALIAKLLRTLHRHCDLDLSDVHIIGHSLGAHAAGYAGENLKGIGRITGEPS